MKRQTYLEEDLALICRYFPGARTVALHTPFEQYHVLPRRTKTILEPVDAPQGHIGGTVWSH